MCEFHGYDKIIQGSDEMCERLWHKRVYTVAAPPNQHTLQKHIDTEN